MARTVGFILSAFVCTCAIAQDTTKYDPLLDPIVGYPFLANSAELISITDSLTGPSTRIPAHRILDVNSAGQIVADLPKVFSAGTFCTEMWSDCITGDFDGNGIDEIVTARVLPYGPASAANMVLDLMMPTRLKPSYYWMWPGGGSLTNQYQYNGPVRLIAARLEAGLPKKFLAFGLFYDVLRVIVYSAATFPGQEATATFSGIATPYDVAAGDFDGDGLDEFVLVSHGLEGTSNSLQICAYKYNPATRQFQQWGTRTVVATGSWAAWKRLKVTTGDFRNLGHDEAAVSLTLTSGNSGRQVFLHAVVGSANPFSGYAVPGESPAGYTWGNGWESDAVAGDLNPGKSDGDELVVAGPGEVAVLKFNPSTLRPYYLGGGTAKTPFLNPGAVESIERRRFLAVADIDADTSGLPWVPEIIVAEHKLDSTTVFRVLVPNINDRDSITGLTQKRVMSTGAKSRKSELAVGDLDGDAIRLGPPTLVTVKGFYQPIVVLNVPPTHFDSLAGQLYDVSNVFGASPSMFSTTYSQTHSQTSHFSSRLSQSWGVSGEISGGFKAFGVKVKGYVSASYDRGHYGGTSFDTTTTLSEELSTWLDDFILATVADYDLWEYPIYAMGGYRGGVIVQIPRLVPLVGKRYLPSKDVDALDWMADHEVGNLLSYMPPQMFSNWIGSGLLTSFSEMSVTPGATIDYTLSLANQGLSESQLSNSIGCEVGMSVSGWGMSARVAANYSREEVVTHSSTATDSVSINVHIAPPNGTLGAVSYRVVPFVYWGKNGALTIDYAVDLPPGQPGLETFWGQHYQSQPDPGFILPWRLDAAKGLGLNPNMKFYCKSLHVSPLNPAPGDRARITARIHNFSLMNTAGPVKVRFYLGNPASGGIPVVGVGGVTDLSSVGSILARDRTTVGMDWIVPSGLDQTARLYAVIDPDGEITEIHEENNVGFIALRPAGATGVEEEPLEPLPGEVVLDQNYPNPFNPATVIVYSVPARSHITLTVYDLLGRTVATLVNETRDAGRHHVMFDAAGLSTGVYFYRLQAGEVSFTKKMIAVK